METGAVVGAEVGACVLGALLALGWGEPGALLALGWGEPGALEDLPAGLKELTTLLLVVNLAVLNPVANIKQAAIRKRIVLRVLKRQRP